MVPLQISNTQGNALIGARVYITQSDPMLNNLVEGLLYCSFEAGGVTCHKPLRPPYFGWCHWSQGSSPGVTRHFRALMHQIRQFSLPAAAGGDPVTG